MIYPWLKVFYILFTIVPDYGNEYTQQKKIKKLTSFKNFAPKLNLNTTYTRITIQK